MSRASCRQGAIAQLGERLNGIQEVGGSIPPGSTNYAMRTRARPFAGARTLPGVSSANSALKAVHRQFSLIPDFR